MRSPYRSGRRHGLGHLQTVENVEAANHPVNNAPLRRRFAPLFVVPLAVLSFVADSGALPDSPQLARDDSTSSILSRRTAQREVDEARRQISSGNRYSAIPRLQHTISKFPKAPASLDARYLLGRIYLEIGSYRDAIDIFSKYVELAPEGTYSQQSREYIRRLTEDYAQRYPTAEDLVDATVAVRRELKESPDSRLLQSRLADLLWQQGRFDDAAAVYMDIVQKDPSYADDGAFTSRIELGPGRSYTILSPTELKRREADDSPLNIINVNTFRSRPSLITQVPRTYVVSGQTVNRSGNALYGVAVRITLYGFGNVVYDTRTVALGRLNPGEIRAFSVPFSNFENMNNIDRVETVGTFER